MSNKDREMLILAMSGLASSVGLLKNQSKGAHEYPEHILRQAIRHLGVKDDQA